MTHEYVIALNGVIERTAGTGQATAVGWADEFILAVGSDEAVRAISRGDSTFLDVKGCAVTPLPRDLDAAQTVVRERGATVDISRLLLEAGLLEPDATLEMGAPADLAFWHSADLVATVRGGHFTDGDDHHGPFGPPESEP